MLQRRAFSQSVHVINDINSVCAMKFRGDYAFPMKNCIKREIHNSLAKTFFYNPNYFEIF